MSIKQNEMVVKDDLVNMQNQIEKNTREFVSSAADPLKDKFFDISARLEKVEKRGPSSSIAPNTETQQLLQNQISALQAQIFELSV